jgi:hypothetical protein
MSFAIFFTNGYSTYIDNIINKKKNQFFNNYLLKNYYFNNISYTYRPLTQLSITLTLLRNYNNHHLINFIDKLHSCIKYNIIML